MVIAPGRGFFPGPYFKKNETMNTIKKLVNDPEAVIVDVRSPWEFDMEHLPCALNIPLEEIPGRVNEFKNMKTPVILYCRSGNRSGMALQLLKQNGLTDIFNGGSITDLQSLLN